MKQDLQDLVNHWSNQSFIHEQRTVHQQDSHGVHGELLLRLTIEMVLIVGKRTEQIKCAKLFHTYENANDAVTSPGDCYRFHRQTAALDNEFGEAYEAKLDEMIKDQYDDGFAKE